MSHDRLTHAPTLVRNPRFALGRLVATPGSLQLLAHHGINPLVFIGRHVGGDFGDLDAEDIERNEQAIESGMRVFSSYVLLGSADKVWCITEADRSITTLLLPSEY